MTIPRAVGALALALCSGFALAFAFGCSNEPAAESESTPKKDPFLLAELPEVDNDFPLSPSEANTIHFEDRETFTVRGRIHEGADAFYMATLIDLDLDISHSECTSEGCTVDNCATGGPAVLSASIVVRFVEDGSDDPVQVTAQPGYSKGDVVEVVGTFHEIDRERDGGSVDRVFYATGYRLVDEETLDDDPTVFGDPELEDPFVRTELPEFDEWTQMSPSEACVFIFEDDEQYLVRGYVHQGARAFHSAKLIDFELCEECGNVCTGGGCSDGACSDGACSTAGCSAAGCAQAGAAVSPSSILSVSFVPQGSHEPVRLEARPHYREGDIIEVVGTFHLEETSDGDVTRTFLASGYRVVPEEELHVSRVE